MPEGTRNILERLAINDGLTVVSSVLSALAFISGVAICSFLPTDAHAAEPHVLHAWQARLTGNLKLQGEKEAASTSGIDRRIPSLGHGHPQNQVATEQS